MNDRPWWNVLRWPRWLRRTFVCTFPISGPLYAVAYVLGVGLFFCAIVPIAIFNTLVGDYWDDPPEGSGNGPQ